MVRISLVLLFTPQNRVFKIMLNCTGTGTDATTLLSGLVKEVLPHNRDLSTISFQGKKVCFPRVFVFCFSIDFTDLNLSKELKQFGKVLALNGKVTRLFFEGGRSLPFNLSESDSSLLSLVPDCGVDLDHLIAFLSSLSLNTSLQVLTLKGLKLRSAPPLPMDEILADGEDLSVSISSPRPWLSVLSRALCSNTTLHTLDISNNFIYNDALKALWPMLSRNTSLTHLSLARKWYRDRFVVYLLVYR